MVAAALASLVLVCPARFEPLPPGWTQSNLGPAIAGAGAMTDSWARSPRSFENLNDIPRNGVYVSAVLSHRPASPAASARAPLRLPLRILRPDAIAQQEGRTQLPEYRFAGRHAREYFVDLRVDFGRSRPTRTMLARAQALLRVLRLPEWAGPRRTRCRFP